MRSGYPNVEIVTNYALFNTYTPSINTPFEEEGYNWVYIRQQTKKGKDRLGAVATSSLPFTAPCA